MEALKYLTEITGGSIIDRTCTFDEYVNIVGMESGAREQNWWFKLFLYTVHRTDRVFRFERV